MATSRKMVDCVNAKLSNDPEISRTGRHVRVQHYEQHTPGGKLEPADIEMLDSAHGLRR